MPDRLTGSLNGRGAGLPQNFELNAGDSRLLKVTVFDENGESIPLAGAQSIVWALARTARSPVAIASKSLQDGVSLLTDQAAQGEENCGRFDIAIGVADTSSLDGEYYHNCRLINSDGETSSIFYGRVHVAPFLNL